MPPPTDVPSGGLSGRAAAGIVTIVLGLGGVGAGAGLSVLAVSKHNDAQAHCTPTCAAGGGDAIQSDAKKYALGADIAFAAGGAVAVLGIVLVATAPSARAPKAAGVLVSPLVSPGAYGATVVGKF
jgi:hypothetical protein